MRASQLSALLAITLGLGIAGCNSDKKGEDGTVANQDIAGAVEITQSLFATDHGNAGYGNVLEIKADAPGDKVYLSSEHNTEWYYFKAENSGRLSLVIDPNDSTEDYNFSAYAKLDGDFEKEVVEKKVLPLATNQFKNTPTNAETGLACEATEQYEGEDGNAAFCKPIEVVKDSTYYICVDHAFAGGKGYSIKLAFCGPGNGGGAEGGKADSSAVAVPPPPTLPDKPAPVAEVVKNKGGKKSETLLPLGPDEEYYTVKPTNTLYSIATSHGMNVYDVLKRNRMTQNHIHVGQKLIVKKYSGSDVAVQPAKPGKQPAEKVSPTPEPTKLPEATKPTEVAKAPEKPADKPAASDKEEGKGDVAPLTGRTTKPVSSGAPATPNSLEAKNAIPDATQKLWVYVNVVNAKNNNPINTIVQVVDEKNTKRVHPVPSNQLAYVPLYNDGGKKKVFVIDAFSFRKESFELDLDNIMNDSSANKISLVNDTVVLNFELERYRKKDIFAAYNIFFYDDASVMLPKSKYELESLLEMLRENPRTRIRIHGHTNSNSIGKIISLEAGDHEFFRLNSKNKESLGTAVQLSKRRAESIMYYLEFYGVNQKRLEIKGWGGRKMIYEKDMPLAHKNKRVEIEILDE